MDLDYSKGYSKRVMLLHPEIIEASKIGHVLLVDDEKMKLMVSGKGEGYLDCIVDNVIGHVPAQDGLFALILWYVAKPLY